MKSTLRLVVLVFTFIFFNLSHSHSQTFKVSPNGKITACLGDTITIEATSGFARYSWNTGSSSRVIYAFKSGTYVATAYDSRGTSYKDSVVINFLYPQRPSLTVYPKSAQICSGDSIVIVASTGFVKYKWGDGSTKSDIVFYPTKSGAMSLQTVDSNGCTSVSYVQYSVKSCSGSSCAGIIDSWPDSILCGSHDSVILEVKNGYSKYTWSDGSTGRVKTIKKAGWYKVTVVDSAGNSCTDSILISSGVKKLKVQTNPSSTIICKGDSIRAYITGDYDSIYWIDGGKNTSDWWYKPTKSGYFRVYAWDSSGCVYRGEFYITVKDSCDECDDILYASKTVLCGDKDSVILEAKSGYSKYRWYDNNGGRVRTVKDDGWYYVTVWDSSGKTCTDSIRITNSDKSIKLYYSPNPAIICKGEKVVVEISNDYDSIWWSNGGRGHRQVLTPTKTTNYVIEAVDKHGCPHRQEFKVTVKDTCDGCDDLIGASKKSLCGEHDSVILEAKTGFVRYIWNNQKDGRVITVKYKGWYHLSAMKSDSTWCYDSIYISSGGKSIEIGSDPRNATVCKGDSIQLEATYGFKSYYWSAKGIKKSNGLKFLPYESMKVCVEAEDEAGCESRACIYVTVVKCDSCPKIIEPWPSTSLCNRDSIALEAKHGYKVYKWSTGKDGRLLWVTKAGWYWLDFKDSSGKVCRDSIYITDKSEKELRVKVYPSRKICKGDTIVLSATEGFKSYGWNTGNKTRIFEMVADKTKDIVVEATDSNGCHARYVFKLVVDTCNHSSVGSLTSKGVTLFPNPTQNTCLLKSTTGNLETVSVRDMLGRLITEIKDVNSSEVIIDLQDEQPGTYIISIQINGQVLNKSLIKLN